MFSSEKGKMAEKYIGVYKVSPLLKSEIKSFYNNGLSSCFQVLVKQLFYSPCFYELLKKPGN